MHPLDRLTENECQRAVAICRDAIGGKALHFKTVMLDEPPKQVMMQYLDSNGIFPPPPRIAYVLYFILSEQRAEQVWIDLTSNTISRRADFPVGFQPPSDWVETDRLTARVIEHPEVISALKKIGITDEEWPRVMAKFFLYGSDTEALVPRLACFLLHLKATDSPDCNIYAGSLPIVPVFDSLSGEFVRVDYCASGSHEEGLKYETAPSPIGSTLAANEYMVGLRPDIPLRTDIKPLHITQPEGPSFTVENNLVRWQKWSFRVHFTPREGVVLHDVCYDGRRTFYRLSVSEMTIPYGDPRPPLHRRQAFDLGDVGAGNSANSLELGCDCLGLIHYFDAALVRPDGSVNVKKNVVCMHEQDDGILYKHTNASGTVRLARRRVLIVQTVFTVANYDYAIAWHLDQAANIQLEIRATGIVSTQYIDPGKTSKWGTIVAPSIVANSHQHIISLRIDPAIDGWKNSVQVNETRLDPVSEVNPYGVGFYNDDSKIIEKSCAMDADLATSRYLKIVNESKINPISKKPIGYKLEAQPTLLLMAPSGTCVNRRALFATHHFWVTQYRDGELYAGGRWTNQSPREVGGCYDAAQRNDNVRNDDIVVWHSFGVSPHHPRPEDFPIMPVCCMKVGLTPDGFFTENPALDVPPPCRSKL